MSLVSVEYGGKTARITLTRAERSNALSPGLIYGLLQAVEAAAARRVSTLVLAAEGRNFSTGGDVGLFAEAVTDGRGRAYARELVGGLHRLIMALLRLPAVVVTAAQGAITGGSAGLILASDYVLLGEDAFLQPWYSRVGFSPDGGWTALLPDRIGAHRALAMQIDNRRLGAAQAVELGLAERLVPVAELPAAVETVLTDLAASRIDSILAAKRLIWDQARLARVGARLDAEAAAFEGLIEQPGTAAGMADFLAGARADA
ncbi:enoyl-CoA hydratase/isomerase family protein [Frigidibacter sp. ROC022]|uniref:enoyl-CoA hydratase/isomerase family protein n=1 Tax=Frigidibacter sp. ROC022 TaxID=2971796 RepID=UPI00215A67F1|nr:enoyl-CoA hydratase/isomerase family protein [Frigidibacter sp. ROC022]MCR8724705.1 enoyl-CoA hydratase/isomerase family protein [Frigidibacter sp. ROC022]